MPTTEDNLPPAVYFLAYEVPGDGEDAWVIRKARRYADADAVGHPLWDTDKIPNPAADPGAVSTAQGWAERCLQHLGVDTSAGWRRLPEMTTWETWELLPHA